MTREELRSKKTDALEAFSHIGEIYSCEPYGNGHINDTFLTVSEKGRYILQRINNTVFPKPDEVMKNIIGITEHIKKKAVQEGNDPARATLTLVKTNDGDNFYIDSYGSYWRMYLFIEGTVAKDKVESIDDFKCCAESFGAFQGILADFDASTLFEPIANFHNTPIRFKKLEKAIKEDKCNRAASVAKEIEFALAHKEFAETLERARESGDIPLRVTHNDTKLNNILFDAKDGSAVCVIDLDTVMPGYSVTDFGDSIRFGANTAAEDETDLSKVKLDLELFKAYTEGFLKGCGNKLTDKEIDLFPVGAMMMTYECGIRFLTDYLEGDVYFMIHREGHNLDRCRSQFALLADMEKNEDKMNAIIKELKK